MSDLDSEIDSILSPPDVHAADQVYQRVMDHLKSLREIHDLVRNTKDLDQPLVSTVEDVVSHILLAVKQTDLLVRLDESTSVAALLLTAQKTRTWLLKMIASQARLDRMHFMRLFRLILESQPGNRSDLQALYFILTATTIGSTRERLRIAFAISLHGNFADKYAKELAYAKQHVYLALLPHSTHVDSPVLATRHKVAEKAETSIIDAIACAIPLSTILISPEEERSCPICRESYIDFTKHTVEALFADYPVRIKFCDHVIGKACLEQWVSTPNEYPEKYPHKECPMCRKQISEREDTPCLLDDFMWRLRDSRFVKQVIKTTGMEEEDMEIAVKREMSEEIAAMELSNVVKKQMMEGVLGEEQGKKAESVLKEKTEELQRERSIWMMQDCIWEEARDAWVCEGMD